VVQETADLKFARGLGVGLLILTKDGRPSRALPVDPLFVVTPWPKQASNSNLPALAKHRLSVTESIRDAQVRSEKNTIVSGMPAHELLAEATLIGTDTRVTVFQVVAEERAVYFVMQGFVGVGATERYLPQFRQAAGSFRLKPGR
jgi:hypothetical protein